jgi:hypothetical protein
LVLPAEATDPLILLTVQGLSKFLAVVVLLPMPGPVRFFTLINGNIKRTIRSVIEAPTNQAYRNYNEGIDAADPSAIQAQKRKSSRPSQSPQNDLSMGE